MARSSGALLTAAVALAGVCHLLGPAFVPSPMRRAAVASLPAAAVAASSAPAFADAIGDAAVELSNAAYPFMKEVPWNSGLFLQTPGAASPGAWAKAIGEATAMGAKMDPVLLKAGVMAHHRAIAQVSEANPVMSKEKFTEINAAIGRMIASVPEAQTMKVYNAFKGLVDPKVPAYLMSNVEEKDAKAAYEAFLKFKDVVKANPITPEPAMPTILAGDFTQIDDAAKKLSEASYPFLKEVPWNSKIFNTPLPGISAQKALKAIDKALLLGADMDQKLLQEAAQAHVKAIASADANGVTSLADYTKVNALIGKLIASVPRADVMGTYYAFAKITDPLIPSNMINLVNPADAVKAYTAFLDFKEVVKGAQGIARF